jgi:hypothetical protein
LHRRAPIPEESPGGFPTEALIQSLCPEFKQRPGILLPERQETAFMLLSRITVEWTCERIVRDIFLATALPDTPPLPYL